MNENLIQKFGMTEDKFLALELSYQAYFTYIIKYKLYYKLYFNKKISFLFTYYPPYSIFH